MQVHGVTKNQIGFIIAWTYTSGFGNRNSIMKQKKSDHSNFISEN